MSAIDLRNSLVHDMRFTRQDVEDVFERFPYQQILGRVVLQKSCLLAGVRYEDIADYTITMLEATSKLKDTKPKEIDVSGFEIKKPPVVKANPEVAARHLLAMREFLKGSK